MENDSITTQFCRKCGAKIPGDSVFCPKCGVKVLCVQQETRYDSSPTSIERPASPVLTPKKGKNGFLSRMDTGSKVIFFLLITLIPMCIIWALVKGFIQEPASSISSPTVATAPPVITTTAPTVPKETLTPKSRPVSGTTTDLGDVQWGSETSKITIHASSRDCVVRLKTTYGTTVYSFYVRANESITLGVPAQKLYAYFAEGDTWYGWSDYFGEDTSYSKDPDPIDFSQYTIEYTLYDVYNGNLNLSSIDEDEF